MSHSKQIFQTNSRWRWRTFQWTGRLLLAGIVLMIPVVIITLAMGIKPGLPLLASEADTLHRVVNPVIPAGLNTRELKK